MINKVLAYLSKNITVNWLTFQKKRSGFVIRIANGTQFIARWKEVPLTKRGIIISIEHSKKYLEEWERTKAWRH